MMTIKRSSTHQRVLAVNVISCEKAALGVLMLSEPCVHNFQILAYLDYIQPLPSFMDPVLKLYVQCVL